MINIIPAPGVTTTEFIDPKQQILVNSIKSLRDTFKAQLALDPGNSDLIAAIAALEAAIAFACESGKNEVVCMQ